MRPQDIHELNRTRPVQMTEYILKDLQVIVTRKIINKEECFTFYFLAHLTFFNNFTAVSCKKGETKVYCGDFRLTFDKGVVSHLKLKNHFAKLDWTVSIMEPIEENIPEGVREPVFPLEEEDNEHLELDTEKAGGWLFREDVIHTVALAIGFCVFLLVLMVILYLKCKSKRGGSLLVPYFNAETQSVDLNRGGYGQLPSYSNVSQPHPDDPAGPAASAQTTSNSAPTAPPLNGNKSLERKVLHQQPNTLQGEENTPSSLVSFAQNKHEVFLHFYTH